MRISLCTFSCLVFSLFSPEIYADEITPPTGNAGAISSTDFFAHKILSDKFNETWSYQLVLDNGTKVFINYASLYVPGSGRKIGCDLSFWNFNGKSYSVGRQYPPERFREKKNPARISIKDEYFMEGIPGKGHRVFFSANKGGLFLTDITFTSALTGKVRGNGIWNINGKKYAQYIHIPYGRIAGKIAYNKDTLTVNGYGYMEHTWQTVQATDLAIRSFNVSSASMQNSYAGRIGITPEGSPWGNVLYTENGTTVSLSPLVVTDNGTAYTGKNFPKGNLRIQWKESAAPLIFDTSRPQQKFSLLDNFDGWIAKQATKLIMGGEVLFYRGRSKDHNGHFIDWSFTGL